MGSNQDRHLFRRVRSSLISPERLTKIKQENIWLPLYSFKFYLFIYLFLAALGLRCCMQVLSSCGEWGLLLDVVRGLLIVVASLVAEHRL